MTPDAPHGWLFAHAARTPDAPAVDSPRVRLTYGALAARVRALAAELLANGLAPGERVLIALPPSPANAVVGLAVQAAGGCACEVSPRLGPDALSAVAAQVGARVAFVFGRDARMWAAMDAARAFVRVYAVSHGALPDAVLELLGRERTRALDESGAGPLEAHFAPPAFDAERPSLVLFTSGSTGTPRGVVLCARNLAANTRAIASYLELRAGDRAMLVLPLSYVYGRSTLHAHLLAGGSVFLDDRFAFPRVVLEAVATERCTNFHGVPATYELIKRQVQQLPAMPSLRMVTQAGGAMDVETARWVSRTFAPAKLFIQYGQTEAGGRISRIPPDALEQKLGTIGLPIATQEVRILDGELVVRGPSVALGYLADPEATRETFRDGWLHTGDLATQDADGYLRVVGRAKEMLKLAGFRVAPAQIEDMLAKHPAVRECAVVGVHDALEGELAVAIAVAPGADEAALRAHCRAALPAYMVPRRVLLLEALPRNEYGKVRRGELRELAARAAPQDAAG